MFYKSRSAGLACVASVALLLSGCGIELGLATGIQAGLQAKKAKGAVDAEKESVKKIEEAMAQAKARNEKAMGNDQLATGAAGAAIASQPDPSAAMKAAEEAAK